jgi:hypothetical protein
MQREHFFSGDNSSLALNDQDIADGAAFQMERHDASRLLNQFGY